MAGAVFWVGADGNLYLNAPGVEGGVHNMGSAQSQGYANDKVFSFNTAGIPGQHEIAVTAQRIADPNAPSGGGGGSAPSGGGGGGGVLNDVAIRNTQRTIDEIPGLLADALATERTRYQNALNTFDAQEEGQRKTYKESGITNQQNYDSNFMESILAGIKGLGGLMNILRGTGASGGTAEDQVKDVVGGITAKDIRTGADTRDENQVALDTTLSNFLTDLRGKRQENEDTFENNQRAVRRDSNTQLQDLYSKMAGFYSDAGQKDQANTWLNKAGDLTPRISADSRTALSKYNTTPVVVKAPELTAFAKPTQPNAISAPEDGQVGSGIFAISDRRKDREPVPAGV